MSLPIRFRDLPPDLKRLALEADGRKPRPRRARSTASKPTLPMKACPCGFEIYRPDGRYPGLCDACGEPFRP